MTQQRSETFFFLKGKCGMVNGFPARDHLGQLINCSGAMSTTRLRLSINLQERKEKSKEVEKRKIKMKQLQGHMGTTPDESMDVPDRNPNQNQ
jgi:hypothetical protein